MSDLFETFEKFKNKQEIVSICEYPLYTDNPRIMGAIESEPISLLNPVIHNHKGVFLPRILLRFFNYINSEEVIDYTTQPTIDSKIKSYESAPNELSYLINLRLGIRTKIGSCTREFKLPFTNNSNYGFIPNFNYYPNFEKEVLVSEYPVIPSLFNPVNLSIEAYFKKLISLSEKNLCNVVRVAKLYSSAIFLAERSPKISWILLVSAIEVAAEAKRDGSNNLALIKQEFPKLYDLIDLANNSKDIFKELNKAINLKAQQKFIKFIKNYYPIPPKRTDLQPGYLINWENFDEILKKIYNYRSCALHSVGVGAFPQEMCNPPYASFLDENQGTLKTVEIERQWVGEAIYGRGKVKVKQEDAPMNLAKFEQIVRSSLLKWIEEN